MLTVLLVLVLGGSSPPPLPLAKAKDVDSNTAVENKMQDVVL
ncbi:hypothetical protein [Alteromonas sp. KUL42]|nr:hypothetical protein [Alteromonas sp. KUL42]